MFSSSIGASASAIQLLEDQISCGFGQREVKIPRSSRVLSEGPLLAGLLYGPEIGSVSSPRCDTFFFYTSIESPPFFLTWEGEGESNAFHVVLYPPPNDNPHSSDFYFLSFPMYANLYYPIHNFSMYIRVPVESRSYKNVSKEKGGGTLSLIPCAAI